MPNEFVFGDLSTAGGTGNQAAGAAAPVRAGRRLQTVVAVGQVADGAGLQAGGTADAATGRAFLATIGAEIIAAALTRPRLVVVDGTAAVAAFGATPRVQTYVRTGRVVMG